MQRPARRPRERAPLVGADQQLAGARRARAAISKSQAGVQQRLRWRLDFQPLATSPCGRCYRAGRTPTHRLGKRHRAEERALVRRRQRPQRLSRSPLRRRSELAGQPQASVRRGDDVAQVGVSSCFAWVHVLPPSLVERNFRTSHDEPGLGPKKKNVEIGGLWSFSALALAHVSPPSPDFKITD
ncbi:MAG: hypothetical protein CM1200mP29_04170 [Verrucomicrobiota bacterium]|nr:MAG: hypothetical protein CM1200mP29_04170 [Verrucomicrobiota bacterium]